MNEFDKELDSHTNKTFGLKVLSAVVLGSILLAYALIVIFAKGYQLKISPTEAVPTSYIEVTSGVAFQYGDSIYTFSVPFSFTVGANKFTPQQVTVDLSTSKQIEITLEPAPGSLTASINNEDPETSWYIDEVLVANGVGFNKELKPGRYNLRVESDFAQPEQTNIEILAAENNVLVIEAKDVEGSIEISSIPVGANLKISTKNDSELTPFRTTVKGGQYNVSVQYEGYKTIEDSIRVTHNNANISRNYMLEPEDVFVQITAQPNDGLLLVNGKQAELGKLTLAANAPHSITYNKDGYYPFIQTVNLAPGETKDLAVTLKQEVGDIVIKTQNDVAIFIDGKHVGFGTYTNKLQTVPHKFELKKKGYRTYSGTIVTKSNTATKIEHKLLTEFDARRAEGRPLFINTIGINTLPFRMTEFTMGSAPNEKGRRRNEHQIKVDFSRPVLVGTHEITEAQFAKYLPALPSSNKPAVNMSWQQAALYCNWLSENEGLPTFYQEVNGQVVGSIPDSNGYRLLTEAEWEWLAKRAKRAASTIYPWGNSERILQNTGNFADESAAGTHFPTLKRYNDKFANSAPVGSFRQERSKLYDLAGNVSEWVHDRYTNQPPAADNKTDYLGPTRGNSHVFKGGNFKSGKLGQLRAAYKETSEGGKDTIGFRIARYQ